MKDQSLVDLVAMSLKLDECHKAMKALYGPTFEQYVTDFSPAIKILAKAHNGNVILGAMRIAKEAPNAMTVALILAVAVELSAREHAAVMQEGKS